MRYGTVSASWRGWRWSMLVMPHGILDEDDQVKNKSTTAAQQKRQTFRQVLVPVGSHGFGIRENADRIQEIGEKGQQEQ